MGSMIELLIIIAPAFLVGFGAGFFVRDRISARRRYEERRRAGLI